MKSPPPERGGGHGIFSMGMRTELSKDGRLMSSGKLETIDNVGKNAETVDKSSEIRVLALIDGFNLYHALDKLDRAATPQEQTKYRKYKWLCLTSLIKRFVAPHGEVLVGVEYFTTYPEWNPDKKLRHGTYVSAQIKMGVHVTFGEFKQKTVTCRASCKENFITHEEKQTDINIAVAMFDLSARYDKLILLTADSDQVPAIKLARKLYPTKIFASLPPIGRKSKELRQCCHQSFKMTEEHLRDCQLPNPLPVTHEGKQYGVLVKPPSWS
jgi:uncharacterized LabA/DUF88 family protein